MFRTLAGLALLMFAPPSFAMPTYLADLGQAPDFSLTERNGETVTLESLRGKVWVAAFVLTRCPDGACPQVARTLQRLQKDFAGRRDVLLVAFTVDPERDDPEELARYAKAFDADAERWLFLTGSEGQIEELLKGFYRPTKVDEKSKVRPHAPSLTVIDRRGKVVSRHVGLRDSKVMSEEEWEANLAALRRSVDKALARDVPLWLPEGFFFPAFNAALNALATVLLLVGYWAIRGQRQPPPLEAAPAPRAEDSERWWAVRIHVACMLLAIVVSAVFLASYLFFHLYVKEGVSTRFSDQAPEAPLWMSVGYYAILLSHTLLAIVATPLALYTAWLGLREQWARHVWLARWTFPIWLYVCTTGVVVYWMLYRLYPSP